MNNLEQIVLRQRPNLAPGGVLCHKLSNLFQFCLCHVFTFFSTIHTTTYSSLDNHWSFLLLLCLLILLPLLCHHLSCLQVEPLSRGDNWLKWAGLLNEFQPILHRHNYTTSDSTPLSRTLTVGLKLVLLTTASTFDFFLELLAGCLLRLRVGLCKIYCIDGGWCGNENDENTLTTSAPEAPSCWRC